MDKINDTYHSDNGPRCMCGGTIYRYDVQGSKVETFCYTCHATDYFFPTEQPESASQASAAHRLAKS